MPKHIIHRQKVVLEIPGQQDAFNYQNKISALFNNGLRLAVENVLDEMVLHDEVIRFDTLNLDLGTITAQNFEKEFEQKFISSLRKAVQDGKSATGSPQAPVITSGQTSQYDAFIYFLLYGSLPWYSNVKNIRTWEDELLDQWQKADWQRVAVWVKNNATATHSILQRLILQFSDKFLSAIVEQVFILQVVPGTTGALTAGEWHSLLNDIYDIIRTLSIQKSSGYRAETWTSIFALLQQQDEKLQPDDLIEKIILFQLSLIVKNNAADFNIAAEIIAGKQALLQKIQTPRIKIILNNIIAAAENGRLPALFNEYAISGSIAGVDNNSVANGNEATIENININRPVITKMAAKEKKQPEKEDVTFVANCGVILLHPFLKTYFADLGLLEKKQFVSQHAQQRAALLLYYLATGETEAGEFDLVLQKILCGYPVEETLPASIELSEKEIEECEKLLRTVVDYWPPLKNTSVAGFRATFLQREGRLTSIQSGWLLRVEQKTVDILLGKLPWGFSTIRLPWMKDLMNIEWA